MGGYPLEFDPDPNNNYMCRCVMCDRVFVGHKRAVACPTCKEDSVDPELHKQHEELKRQHAAQIEKAKEGEKKKTLHIFGMPVPFNPQLDALLKAAVASPPSAEEVRRQIEGVARAEAEWKEDITTRIAPARPGADYTAHHNPCADIEGRGWNATHRHIKTGRLYTEVCRAILEKTFSPVVVYRDRQGTYWVRPIEEFDDPSRFEVLIDGK